MLVCVDALAIRLLEYDSVNICIYYPKKDNKRNNNHKQSNGLHTNITNSGLVLLLFIPTFFYFFLLFLLTVNSSIAKSVTVDLPSFLFLFLFNTSSDL